MVHRHPHLLYHHHHHKVEQREEGDGVSEESLALVQRYNDIIASLTDAFFQVRSRDISQVGFITKALLLSNLLSQLYYTIN